MTTRELTKALNAIVRNYSGTKKAPKRLFKAELEDRTLISDGHTVYGLVNQDFEFVIAKLKNADIQPMESLIKIWADSFKNADADAEIYGGYDIDEKLSVYVIRNDKTDVVVNKKFLDVVADAEIKISGAKSPLTACNDEIKAIVLPINNKLSREELTAKCDEVKAVKEEPKAEPVKVRAIKPVEPVKAEEPKKAEKKTVKKATKKAEAVKKENAATEDIKVISVENIEFPKDCRVQRKGNNLWVDGNTKPIKDMLKQCGFKYAPKYKKAVPARSAWYKVVEA